MLGIDHHLSSNDGAAIYHPASVSLLHSAETRDDLHKRYYSYQNPFLVAVETVCPVEVEDLASDNSTLIQ
jgi:hypothetical protein